MANVNALISERLKAKEPSTKMAALAEKSAAGHLSNFSGFFQVVELSEAEQKLLEELLVGHANEKETLKKDLKELISITSEIKAINHQAALLHGERIKKAQSLLKNYKEGAFTTWLSSTYGNRQTPYNLLKYFEFYQLATPDLRTKIEKMPRQAIYTLATREGDLQKKMGLIASFQGETKQVLLIRIRELFPLATTDKRKENPVSAILQLLEQVDILLNKKSLQFTKDNKETFKKLLSRINSRING